VSEKTPERHDVTEVLLRAADGSAEASDRLYSLLYEELRKMAGRHMRKERQDHTLQPTELVHEAYVRLIDQTRCQWRNRAHFLAVASRAMRRILVDHARGRARAKRGGGWDKRPLEEAMSITSAENPTTILALDKALDRFAQKQPEKARIVEMHFFGGLTHQECADVLGISARTVLRHWEYAQAWLYREMSAGPDPA
jgi:RNA polymerase sigma factor (TIGR02999 family)